MHAHTRMCTLIFNKEDKNTKNLTIIEVK